MSSSPSSPPSLPGLRPRGFPKMGFDIVITEQRVVDSELVAHAHPQQGDLELILDGTVGARRDVHLTYARSARRRGVVRAFVEFVLEYVATVPIFQQ
jgi:hypothetical protein